MPKCLTNLPRGAAMCCARLARPLLVLLLGTDGAALSLALALVAPVLLMVGLLAERWLFFAEARHVVNLFYGRQQC